MAKDEKLYTEDEVVKLIQRALKKQEEQKPSIVQVAEDRYVQLTFIGVIASGTSVNLGALGKISRPGTVIDVPKKDFIKSLGVPVVEALLRSREIIVVDGLTDAERERFGLKYKDKEVLSVDEFFNIPKMSVDELSKRMDEVCVTHKKVIADVVLGEYFEKSNPSVTLAFIKKLSVAAKRNGLGDVFYPALNDMAQQIIQED
nr:MAG TPA: hypothetical protein [Caudoviricetes sp.]